MATFEITAPDGKTYRVDGPSAEGAAKALASVLSGGPKAPPEPKSMPEDSGVAATNLPGQGRVPSPDMGAPAMPQDVASPQFQGVPPAVFAPSVGDNIDTRAARGFGRTPYADNGPDAPAPNAFNPSGRGPRPIVPLPPAPVDAISNSEDARAARGFGRSAYADGGNIPQVPANAVVVNEGGQDFVKVPKEWFDQQMAQGMPEGMVFNPGTGQVTSRDLLKGNVEANAADAAGMGYMQGYTLNSADEGMGAVAGDFAREKFRAADDAAREAHPLVYGLSQVAGNITSPATKLAPVKTIKGAAAVAGTEAAVDSFNRGEGGAAERIRSVPRDAATGALFGATTAAAFKGLNYGTRKLFEKSVKRPTVENLRATKNAAYSAVDNSGEVFQPSDMQALYQRVQQAAADANFDDIADPQTAAALRILERRQGETVTLTRLDKLRQSLWDRYNRGDEPIILDMIGAIDDLISSRAGSSELMGAARAANARYAKAQVLENAFKKARLQTAATGSGGNILNKYRQAVTRIITNPKEARFFSEDEIALMEQFVMGTDVENTLRRAGKLAPGGNGLMTALNVYAASVDPSMLAITGAAAAAKGAADRASMKGSENILDAVSTGVIASPRPKPVLSGPAAAGGIAGSQYFSGR